MDKRKKKIASGLAGFLVFMWLCTLISKSIYAAKLPMVTTVSMQEKYVEHTVKAEGIVEAGAKRAVHVLGGLRVAELCVHTGDRVEEGALLFRVDLEDLTSLVEVRENACEKTRLQIDAILHNRELADARQAAEEARAREDYDAYARYQDTLVGRAAEAVAQAEEALEELQEENRAHEGDWKNGDGEPKSEEEMEAERKAREEAEEQLKQNLQAAAYAEADARWNRDNTLKDAGRRVEDSLEEKDADAALALYRTELAAAEEELAAYSKIAEQEGQILAPAAGIVTDIRVEVGGRVPDTASLLLSDDEVPCQFRVTLTKEDVSYVNLKDEVKLELDGSRPMDAVIDYLAENETMPGSFTAVINLPEGVGMPGQSGVLSRSEPGKKQNTCIPVSALYTTENRSFVYVAKEREGILGPEYYVEEITVSVLDKNDVWAAVQGALTEESRIVENATAEIKKGDVVRLAEP